jgi:hypothetical protein
MNSTKKIKLIMGCDYLTDFLPGSVKLPLSEKVEILKYAYDQGICTFDVSVCSNFINAFNDFLQYTNGDVTGIGNLNWKCGFKLNNQDLWDIQNRIRRTLLKKYFTVEERKCISSLPEVIQKRWFLPNREEPILTKKEVSDIYLDEKQFEKNLKTLNGLVKIVIFGSNYLEWLTKLNRLDLIKQGLEIIRNAGFTPWSISHWPSVTAPIIRDLPFEGHWIHYNKLEQLIIPDQAFESIRQLSKPITVFRVLSCGLLSDKFQQAVQFVINSLYPDNLVIGIHSIDDINKIIKNCETDNILSF